MTVERGADVVFVPVDGTPRPGGLRAPADRLDAPTVEVEIAWDGVTAFLRWWVDAYYPEDIPVLSDPRAGAGPAFVAAVRSALDALDEATPR